MKNIFYVNVNILNNVMHYVTILILIIFMWKCHFNLMSICNSNIFMLIFDSTATSLIFIVARMLKRFVLCDKWINSYFSKTKIVLWRLVHQTQIKECVLRLHNSFLWIFYKSANLCYSQNWLLWFLFLICQSISTSRHWKTNIIWMT